MIQFYFLCPIKNGLIKKSLPGWILACVELQFNLINHLKWFHSLPGLFVPLTKWFNAVLSWKNGWFVWIEREVASSLPALAWTYSVGAWSIWWPELELNGAELHTMSDTIAILQIHSKIQYLQLSHTSSGADIFEPPTKSAAKWYFVVLWHFVCIVLVMWFPCCTR